MPPLEDAFGKALAAALTLAVSHSLCVAIIMHLDLSGKWAQYSINKNRSVSALDYYVGMKSFAADLAFCFIPFMTFCFWYNEDKINNSVDSPVLAITKLACGYVLGKVWAFGVHYALHFPSLYRFHRRHHRNPRAIVAAAAWEDSWTEYIVMELPSFFTTLFLFPTHFYVHLFHFALHGWDGACGHSGFSNAPGILGYMFDGEYHYHHHNSLTINYAELEFLDKLCGTHHTQKTKKVV